MEHLLSHGLCHERVVIRVRIYVPIAVDAYVLDVGRFGRLSRANERRDSNRRHEPSLSTSIVQAAAGRCHRCGRALRCAPPPSASCPACTGENAECARESFVYRKVSPRAPITPSTRKPLGSTILLYTYTHIHSLGSDTLVNVVALPVQCERLARTRISQISPFGSFRHWSKVGSGSRSKEFENLLSSV